MLNITADTNILISATIAKGNEYRILLLAKKGKIHLSISPQILKEFKGVISRPRFGFSSEQVDRVLKQIIHISHLVLPTLNLNVIKDDPDDDRILECALAANSDYIISGDKHLLTLKEFKGIKIIRSFHLLETLQGSKP